MNAYLCILTVLSETPGQGKISKIAMLLISVIYAF